MDPNFKFNFLFLFFLFFSLPTTTITSNVSEKFDQVLVPDAQVKCGSCPCVNPCALLPPPPPPPPPPPKTTYCPPLALAPPPPRFIYVTAVPGAGNNDLYVTDPYHTWDYYSAATLHISSNLLLLAALAVVHLIITTLS